MPYIGEHKTVERLKATKNSIPTTDGIIVQSALLDIRYTKSAEERAAADGRKPNLSDGLAMEFLHLHYWIPGDSKGKQLVDWKGKTSAAEVTFPCDIINPDGTVNYMWILNQEYLNDNRVTQKFGPHGGYMKPVSEIEYLMVYDASACSQLGWSGGQIADMILNLELTDISDEELDKIGYKRPTEKVYPISNFYRVMETWTSKKDGKKDFKFVITGWSKEEKKNNLGGDESIIWISEAERYMLQEAVEDRNIRKKDDHPF